MSYKTIIKDLKAKKYSPVYFLQGDEAFFIDEVTTYIEHHILSEAEKAFNQVVMYGKEISVEQIIDQAMQYPMMSTHRVVIVKEAQYLRSLDDLKSYINNPSSQTILVLAHKHKKFDKRKKSFWDALKKNATILETKKLYDNKIPGFISDQAKEYNLGIDGKTATVISEHLGNDLSKISNELSKLALNLDKGTDITLDHVQEYIGISKDYNIFELQKAIGHKNKAKCYQIIKHFSQNEKAHPIHMNIGALFSYFNKIFMAKKFMTSDNKTLASKLRVNPFFTSDYKTAAKNYNLSQIRNAFYLLHELDKKAKGVDARNPSSLSLYQEFIFKLLAA